MKAGISYIRSYIRGIPVSYAQVYFNNKVWPGVLLLLLTFFDFGMGLSGLVAIIICQLCGEFFNIEREYMFDGSYTYNSLLVGLALGSVYKFTLPFFLLLAVCSMLALFITIWLAGRLSPKGLPFLTMPFLLVSWITTLGLSNFGGLKLVSKETFSLQQWIPSAFTVVNSFVDQFALRDMMHMYLRSFSAVIFQYNDLAGLVVAVVVFLRSRMAFMLSIYGFLIGHLFYYYFEGDFTPLIYSYIGFNFMITAIALGGYFIVPSTRSHLLLFFVIPVTVLITSALQKLFSSVNLPLYSLPFNIVVLLMISVLQMRKKVYGLQLVEIQQHSPEANHYKAVNYKKRFKANTYYHLTLPVIGEWYISQGYSGSLTHKEGWRHALDFDVRNHDGQTYKQPGTSVKDYYCYELPVVSPAAGYVVQIYDGVHDNAIKETNDKENWGNTIIIKHAEGLYSKLSHLRLRSFKVMQGDYVRAGEIVALCGSSGHSPEPHLHFQMQANPYIGSQTIPYPIAYYLVKQTENTFAFHSFDVPKEKQTVRTVVPDPVMRNAFEFLPGKEIIWHLTDGKKTWENKWSVYADAFGKRYLYCHSTGAAAYFINDGVLFYFTDFYGSSNSFLYKFQLMFQKVLLACYRGVSVTDAILPHSFFNLFINAAQDIVAPFFHFVEGEYSFEINSVDNYKQPGHIVLQTHSNGRIFGKKVAAVSGQIAVNATGIDEVKIFRKKKTITARCAS